MQNRAEFGRDLSHTLDTTFFICINLKIMKAITFATWQSPLKVQFLYSFWLLSKKIGYLALSNREISWKSPKI